MFIEDYRPVDRSDPADEWTFYNDINTNVTSSLNYTSFENDVFYLKESVVSAAINEQLYFGTTEFRQAFKLNSPINTGGTNTIPIRLGYTIYDEYMNAEALATDFSDQYDNATAINYDNLDFCSGIISSATHGEANDCLFATLLDFIEAY